MTTKENVKAILECYFSGYKDEYLESVTNRIMDIKEPHIKICGDCANWHCDEPLHLVGHCAIDQLKTFHGQMCDTCTKFSQR